MTPHRLNAVKECTERGCKGKMQKYLDSSPRIGVLAKDGSPVLEHQEYWECRKCGYVQRT